MTSQPIPHNWPMIANALGVDMTAEVNPLELGHPFMLTPHQRCYLEPYLRRAGEGGCVIVQCAHNPFDNWLHARPMAMTARQRKSIRASLTRIKNSETNNK